MAIKREVAQLGRAPRSGRGGRRFKSCLPDFFIPQVRDKGARILAPYLFFEFKQQNSLLLFKQLFLF
jgi:hypothetical protein